MSNKEINIHAGYKRKKNRCKDLSVFKVLPNIFYVSIHTSYVDVNKLFRDLLYLEMNQSAEIISTNIIPKNIDRKL